MLFLKKLITEKGNNCKHFSAVFSLPIYCIVPLQKKSLISYCSANENDAIRISDPVAESSAWWNGSVTCSNITGFCQIHLSSLASSVTCESDSLKK